MTGAPTPEVKGWCPGALRPMLSGDGWLVRVRPFDGRLTGAQAAGLADLARRMGNGVLGLSNRANLQIRGVREDAVDALTSGLNRLGLLDIDVDTEARRNIITAPDWVEGDGTIETVTALRSRLTADALPGLSGKFGFAVDIGPRPLLRAAPADVRIEGAGDDLVVSADGANRGAPATRALAANRAVALAQWFIRTGGVMDGRGRMAAHLARANVDLPAAFRTVAVPAHPAPTPRPGPVRAGFLVGFEFGQLCADTLLSIAALGPLRMTPWRMILIEGLTAAPGHSDLITNPDDPRLRVVACPGAPVCIQGRQETRVIARALAAYVPVGRLLHVAGCAKGCAHPGEADVTLVGHDGGFAAVRDGNAASPAAPAMAPDAILRDAASLFGGADAISL